MNWKFKPEEQKEEDESGLDLQIPNTKDIMQRLEVAAKQELQLEHREENEKQGKNKQKPKQRQGGVICCCGAPGCGIGPMVELRG